MQTDRLVTLREEDPTAVWERTAFRRVYMQKFRYVLLPRREIIEDNNKHAILALLLSLPG